MKTHYKKLLIILILFLGAQLLVSQETPHYHMRYYWPEDWRGSGGASFADDPFPDSVLVAITATASNEPMWAYPFASGHVQGISDTIIYKMFFRNRNYTAYDISSESPENWFQPALYDIGVDPRKSYPVAEASDLNYSFFGWQTPGLKNTTKPNSIPSEHVFMSEQFGLIYYLWNLPVGRHRLIVEKTASAPTDLKALKDCTTPIWVSKPATLADTVNAYAACFWRANLIENNTAALSWTDTILAYNPTSLVGYTLQYAAHRALLDTNSQKTALDSVVAIAERFGDPVLPDSSDMNRFQQAWFRDIYEYALYWRWQIVTGNYSPGNL